MSTHTREGRTPSKKEIQKKMIVIKGILKDTQFDGKHWIVVFKGEQLFTDSKSIQFEVSESHDFFLALHSYIDVAQFQKVEIENKVEN